MLYDVDGLIKVRLNEILATDEIECRSAEEWKRKIQIAIENGDLVELSALAAAQFELEK